jgi:hypothetical protein
MDFQAGKATVAEQVVAVKEYAKVNYKKGAWDIVECWGDAEIIEEIKGTTTRWGAVERIGKGLKTLDSYRKEATAF